MGRDGDRKWKWTCAHFYGQSSHRSMADVPPRPLGGALDRELHGWHGPCCWPDRRASHVHERGPRRVEEKARDIDDGSMKKE